METNQQIRSTGPIRARCTTVVQLPATCSYCTTDLGLYYTTRCTTCCTYNFAQVCSHHCLVRCALIRSWQLVRGVIAQSALAQDCQLGILTVLIVCVGFFKYRSFLCQCCRGFSHQTHHLRRRPPLQFSALLLQ